MTRVHSDFVWGVIYPTTALYYFKKMELFLLQKDSEALIETETELNIAIFNGFAVGFEMGTYEELKAEYVEEYKTTRLQNTFPFREWLENKKDNLLDQI